eukprot:CAMPEP_0183507426 /NCGR_PEP_ID=MMETSP0371-20130417/8220_1 /TAXON_ID=268820 /ORGANISM="Peridinium aciculiferum, Strain PAER-2" /LENGTH=197 /DNA_ID=CAMNT_0025703637 /DNA_START=108 /DNA_END=697 /DNA_ORIENTATION=-
MPFAIPSSSALSLVFSAGKVFGLDTFASSLATRRSQSRTNSSVSSGHPSMSPGPGGNAVPSSAWGDSSSASCCSTSSATCAASYGSMLGHAATDVKKPCAGARPLLTRQASMYRSFALNSAIALPFAAALLVVLLSEECIDFFLKRADKLLGVLLALGSKCNERRSIVRGLSMAFIFRDATDLEWGRARSPDALELL